MAILKHLSSKNSNYGKALEYLVYQHNEMTQKPIRDDRGNMMMREEYYLDGINCQPLTFAKECEMLNSQYKKNLSEKEVKSHHYIISFDPRDKTEAGLIGDKAQELGIEFTKKYFAGHQALVCTHTDGHNGSGNIHVHIVINSLRKYDCERQDFMERDYDNRAGYKHHQTRKYLAAMQEGLMDICQREHLHQVDLLSPAPDSITEQEYWKARRDQSKIDKLESQSRNSHDLIAKTKFQTEKQFIRDAIQEVSAYAQSPEEFGSELEEHYGIRFKISRGRYSYLHPDRNKYIRGRALGSDYIEDYLRPIFDGNRNAGRTRYDALKDKKIIVDQRKPPASARRNNQPDYDPSYDYTADPIAALHFYTRLRLVVDLQTSVKALQSRAYARKIKLSNLKQMASTICFVQEHGFNTQGDIDTEYDRMAMAMTRIEEGIQNSDQRIRDLNEQIHYAGQLYVNRNIILKGRRAAAHSDNDLGQFMKDHEEQQTLWDEARNYFNEKSLSVPRLDDLKRERDRLIKMKEAQKTAYTNFKEFSRELDIVRKNVEVILSYDRSHSRNKETAQDR